MYQRYIRPLLLFALDGMKNPRFVVKMLVIGVGCILIVAGAGAIVQALLLHYHLIPPAEDTSILGCVNCILGAWVLLGSTRIKARA